jgi:hypothetical protein
MSVGTTRADGQWRSASNIGMSIATPAISASGVADCTRPRLRGSPPTSTGRVASCGSSARSTAA